MRHYTLSIFLQLLNLCWTSTAFPQIGLQNKLPCTLPGIALVGGDLSESDGGGGIRANTPEDCLFECHRRAQCSFWSFVEVNCYLKSEAGEERKMEGAVTGWKGDACTTATKTTRPPSLLEEALKSSKRGGGSLLQGLQAAQQQEGGGGNKQGLLDNVGCTLEKTALLGHDLPPEQKGDGIKLRSFVECRTACREQSACRAFTFVKEWDKNCFLKADKGEESEFEGAVSGTLDSCSVALLEKTVKSGRPSPSPSRPLVTPSEQPDLINRIPLKRRQQLPGAAAAVTTEASVPSVAEERPVQIVHSVPSAPAVATASDPGAECLFENTNFLGGDLPKADGGDGIEAKDKGGCAKECQKRPTCKYWTFVEKWKVNCYLKTKLGEKSDFEGGVSGTFGSNCDSLNSPKTSGGSDAAEASTAPVVSGGPVISGDGCTFANTNFLGGDLAKGDGGEGIETKDQNDCSQECKKRPNCKYWTFVEKWKVNCYLKAKLGEKSDFEGGVSGAFGPNCGSPDSPDLKSTAGLVAASSDECLFPETNFLGGALPAEDGGDGIETKDHQDCSKECQKRPACHFWTFVEKWKVNCYPKFKLGEKSDFEGGVSGTFGRYCDTLQLRPKKEGEASTGGVQKFVSSSGEEGCLFENTNFLGGALPDSEGGAGIEVKDYLGCDEACKKQSKCHYWTFVEKWKVNCYLKDRLGEKSEFEGGVSGTYGERCTLGPISPPSSSSSSNEKSHGSESSSKLILETVKDGAGCRYPEVNLQGGDLQPQDGGHGIETADPDHCRDECGKRKKCQFWSFVKEWKVNCYLKERKGPEREMEGATSGAIFVPCDKEVDDELGELGEARENDHECAYKDLTFMGSDLPAKEGGLGISTGDDEGCRQRCLQSPYCKHWVSVTEWKVNCYLKSERVTPEKKEGATAGSIGVRCLSGATSLPSAANAASPLPSLRTSSLSKTSFKPQVVVAPTNNRKDHCQYPGLNYQGGDLSDAQGGNGVATETPDDCASECEKQSACQFWTYVKEWKVNCYLKASFDAQSSKDGATSGSIGVKCDKDYVPPPPAADSDDAVGGGAGGGDKPAAGIVKPDSGKPSNKVPKKPSSAPDSVCFFQEVNLLGGDLPKANGGEGAPAADANACAVACYQKDKCKYWVYVVGWKNNCFLKTHFDEEESFPNATSGSVGLSCT